MKTSIITNAIIINEGRQQKGSVLIREGRITAVHAGEAPAETPEGGVIIDACGKYLLPGVIDGHVHFREPGLTHKGDIYSESRAAVAGGVTSYLEMPNTVPQTTTQERLAEKFALAAQKSLANYSFYIGATNDNFDELLKTDLSKTCGVKLFLGSSTGNMQVENLNMLGKIFGRNRSLIYRWIKEAGLKFDDPVIDGEIKEIEFDEMWHYIGKKNEKSGSSKRLIAARGELLPGYSVVVMLKHSDDCTTK